MNPSQRHSRLPRQVTGWLLTAAFAFGVYRLYRWAEPPPQNLANVLSPTHVSNVNLELEDTSFENFADGYKNWSLSAKRIVLERPYAGGTANSLQSADIEEIRNGKLFAQEGNRVQGTGNREQGTGIQSPIAPPEHPNTRTPEHPTPNTQHPTPDSLTQSSADATSGLPAATFDAQHGRYLAGTGEGVPADMLVAYTVQWQFQLTGNVHIVTREGYQLNAPAILMLELLNRRTGKMERQMLCTKGAEIKAKGATVLANEARYDAKSQMVECLGGVRAQLKRDSVQAEAFHWSLKENVIRCPETASGTWQSVPFTAQNLLIDVKHHRYLSAQMILQLSEKNLPSP